MASDDPGAAKPAPVLLRIKLRYDDVDTMVQRFAPNVGKAGLFLPTKSMQPIGTEIKFELKLSNDTPVIVGLGRVKHVRPADPANPKAVVGIGIELMRVTRESRDVIMRMLERRRQLGLAETALPTADEIDAARRDVDTGVRGAPEPAPVPVVTAPEPLMTAPRRASGPIAVQKIAEKLADAVEAQPAPEPSRPVAIVPAALAPEPSRRHVRRSISDVIASASAATSISAGASMFDSADEVDVKSVLARARTLAASTDLDAELDALREGAAAPIEISVEAASAELARALGGAPVARKRWAVPPPTAPAPAITEVDPPVAVAATAIAALADEARVETRSFIDEPAAEPEAEAEADDLVEAEEDDLDPRAGYIRDETGVEDEDDPIAEPPPPVGHAHRAAEAVAAALAEEPAHDPDDDGEPLAFVPTAPEEISTEPRHEAVGSGLLIDDDVDPSVFESGGDTAGPPVDSDDPPEEFSMDAAVEGHGDRTQFGAMPLPDIDGNARLDEALAAAEAAADLDEDFAFPSEPIEEIDDFEILAEADVDELVVADVGPGGEDFVARLDLSNTHDAVAAAPDPLAGFERDSVIGFDDPLAGFEDDAPPPQPVWDPIAGRYLYPQQPPPIEHDLENALEALDVDLDELGGPQVQTQPHAPRPVARAPRAPRAVSEDGILIDFDDDE